MPEEELKPGVHLMHPVIGHTADPPTLRVEVTDDGPMRTVNVELSCDAREASGLFAAIAPHISALTGGQS